jgi:hypothetical protein
MFRISFVGNFNRFFLELALKFNNYQFSSVQDARSGISAARGSVVSIKCINVGAFAIQRFLELCAYHYRLQTYLDLAGISDKGNSEVIIEQ